MQIGVITNPNSRKNKGRPNRAAHLQTIVGNLGEVHETDSVESIKPVLRDFLRKRARYWVADGGDGAMHWMINMGMEVLQEDEFRDHTLPLTMPTNGGTIDFVAQNVGIRGNAESLLAYLRGALERRRSIEEVEVDSMLIEGVRLVDGRDEEFLTYGFASAAGGVGQRFFAKYYEDEDPNPRTIVKVIGNAMASLPVAYSPLRAIPGMPETLRHYARDVFKATPCRITMDGMILPDTNFKAVHVASMSINLGNVLKFFGKADKRGQLHALVGTPNPLQLFANIPRMHLGMQMRGKGVIDRATREMTVEAVSDDELLEPIIDGEYYRDVKSISFKVGPRVRIPKIVSEHRA